MNTNLLAKIENKVIRKDLPNFKVGDTITIDYIIREGERKRNQKFTGLVIAINNSGARKTFTMRKLSYGIGVERIIPWNSPNIAGIEVLKHGKVRRSKIYYMRDRVGKAVTRVKPGRPAQVIEHEEEFVTEENMELASESSESEVEADTPVVDETVVEETPVESAENADSEVASTEETPAAA